MRASGRPASGTRASGVPDAARLHLRLPATSANLGSGFDATAVALNLFLEITAETADDFFIAASGRDAARCARLEDNLILDTYARLLAQNDRPAHPLSLKMVNAVPLGMGCGSSAAGRLAAIALANHFGNLGWTGEQILEEACALEGHPDNAAACWLGGFVATAGAGRRVYVARAVPPSEWRAIVVLPSSPLATSEARAVLPERYSRADAVLNVQSAALLGLAFAQGRGDLLAMAMRDRLHQPYRESICPMLAPLLPLAGSHGILGVALSGAGPAVLVILEDDQSISAASQAIRAALTGLPEPDLLICEFESGEGQIQVDYEPS
ncbi:MAG TPA: homoserine kinase [Terracidiphilus sp.]|nr:homoserine kinase [Terracidiphilus sp.]